MDISGNRAVEPKGSCRPDNGGSVHASGQDADGAPQGTHTRDSPPVPWELPPPVQLTDRTYEIDDLNETRRKAEQFGGSTFVMLTGLGGVGKTVLATSWLRSLRDDFPAGQLYVNLGAHGPEGPLQPGEVLGRFLRALGVAPERIPAEVDERAATYRSLTAGRRLVVLLDDAATAAQIRPLLPNAPGIAVVTSRTQLTGLTVDGFSTLRLEPLGQDDAVTLLASMLDDDRVRQDPAAAGDVVRLCDGLPLAVRLAGAQLVQRRRRTLAAMAQVLEQEQGRLDVLAIAGDHAVRSALDLSYRGLPAAASRLYRWLGLHPGPDFGSDLVAAALADPAAGPMDPTGPLDTLVEASLLSEVGAERYRFHDLVRLHASAQAERQSPDVRAAAQRRILDFHLVGTTLAEEILDPHHRSLPRDLGPQPVPAPDLGGDAERAMAWLEAERGNLMAAVRAARRLGLHALAWQLVDAMWPLFIRRKYYEDWREAHIEGLAAARSCGDRAAEARMLTSGGFGELGVAEHVRALSMFEEAAAILQESGDGLGHARTFNYRGLAYQRLGRLPEAADAFEQAAALCARHGDTRAGALALLNRSSICLTLADFGRAAELAARAKELLLEKQDPYNAARAEVLLGRARLALGSPDLAEETLLGARDELHRTGAGREEALALEALGETAEQRGQPTLARERYAEAVRLWETLSLQPPDSLRQRLDRLDPPG